MIELVDQLALVDDIREPDRRRPVDELKSNLALRMQFPDHLEHQELVKIGVEQRSHRRIDAKRVIIDAGCDIRGHYASLGRRRLSDKSAAPSWAKDLSTDEYNGCLPRPEISASRRIVRLLPRRHHPAERRIRRSQTA